MRNLAYALFVLLTVGCACKAKQPATSIPAAESPLDEAPIVNEQPVAAPSAPEAPTGCQDDRSCEGYLRCIANACTVPPAVSGEALPGMATATFHNADGVVATYHIELAVEPWERTRGLMYRRKMDPRFGMLFVFEDDDVRSFWMKNTYLPLDMVHIDSKGEVVGVVASAEPMTTSPRRTGKPARYVLELVAGAAAEQGIQEGVTMQLANVPEVLHPE